MQCFGFVYILNICILINQVTANSSQYLSDSDVYPLGSCMVNMEYGQSQIRQIAVGSDYEFIDHIA